MKRERAGDYPGLFYLFLSKNHITNTKIINNEGQIERVMPYRLLFIFFFPVMAR